MKVLHVLSSSIPEMAGYTARAYYLVHGQYKLGVAPVVLTSERQSSHYVSLQETIEGVTYYRSVKQSGGIRNIPVLAQLDETRALARRVTDVVEKERIELVHAHSPSFIGAACLDVCRRNRIPLVYEIRAFWEDAAVDRGAFAEGSLMYKLRWRHETKVVRNADAVITICKGLHNDLTGRGIAPEKLHIVPNGVDHQLFLPVAPDENLRERLGLRDRVTIGFIGSFFNFEGLQDIVQAMPTITASNEKVVLLLVGKGQVDAELRALVKSLKLEEQVMFIGQVPHDQVNSYYSIIDLLVYPRISKRITELVTPLKPLEAMSMAKTVLMSDVGGLRELATEENVAEFFRAGDIKDLADKCIALCNDKARREQIGLKAREYVIAGWGWDKRAKADVDLYQSLIQVFNRR